jgi:hypothetical protein
MNILNQELIIHNPSNKDPKLFHKNKNNKI